MIRRRESSDKPCDGPLVPEEIVQAQRYWIVLPKDSSETGKRATKI